MSSSRAKGLNMLLCEADHLLLSSAEVKNGLISTSVSIYESWYSALLKRSGTVSFNIRFAVKPFRRIARGSCDWVVFRLSVSNSHPLTGLCPGDTATTITVTADTCPFLTKHCHRVLHLLSHKKNCPSYLSLHLMFGLQLVRALHAPLFTCVVEWCVTWGGGKVLGCNKRPQVKRFVISCYSVGVVVLEGKLTA
jgi:hypothetical protein